MERHMEFYEGYEQTGVVERALHTFLFGSRAQVQNDAIRAYQEVLDYLVQHPKTTESWDILNTKARWLITIAELRSQDELKLALKQFDNNPEEEVIAAAVRYAYFDDYKNLFSPEVYTGATMVPTGWAKDRLRLRINTRLNKPYFIKLFSERLLTNGKRLRQHVLQIAITIACVILVGLFVMIRYRIFYIQPPWKNDILDHPWPFYDGIAVAVPAAVFGLLIWLGLHLISSHFFRPSILTLWSTIFASLPMLWLIHHYLLKPRGLNLVSAFGLSLGEIKFRDFFALTIALLSLELVGLLLIGWGTWKLGLGSHWAQGIQERLVFGTTETVIFSVINIIIWTPIFEEIGFRGLIYTSLRQRLTPTMAIVLSALLFSALHLKSVNGFLSIFWSGLILAYAYEKYRSLLPGILIHSAGNLLYLSTILLFYR
jgi:membrane protease YdiL (CAAX protease family)